MKSKLTLLTLVAITFLSLPTWGQQEAVSWKPVETEFGRSGKLQPDGAFKFSMPRKDLNVTVSDTPISLHFAGITTALSNVWRPCPLREL